MKTKHFISLLPAAALLLAAQMSTAQDQPRRPRAEGAQPPEGGARPEGQGRQRPADPADGAPREGGPRGQGQGRGGFGGPQIELTDAQREAIRTASEGMREDMEPLMQRMGEARRALQEAIYAEKQSADTIKARAHDVAEIQADVTVMQAQMIAKVRSKFSAEEMERIRNVPVEMLMMRAGVGGRGGFGPGGPGGQRPDGQGVRPDGAGRRPGGDNPDGAPARRGGRPEAKQPDKPKDK
ncbi:MAG: hypothetical protein HY301_02140 [Verrucomicrobia bacterium]|nr:hypothetical protein [Verrucomicrobiota bacterium]